MFMKHIRLMLPALFLVLTAISCKKLEDPAPPAEGSLIIAFNHAFGNDTNTWDMSKEHIVPKTGDKLTFTNFKYYVSNVKLQRADSTWWVMPESYFLVDAQKTETSTINIHHVPGNTYIAMSCTLGIDSARNVNGPYSNALASYNGMYWDENKGFIMLKAEGYSVNSTDGTFSFELGGYSGSNSVVSQKTIFFGKDVSIGNGGNPTLTLTANAASLWATAPSVNTRKSIKSPSPEAKTMATDFYNSITMASIK